MSGAALNPTSLAVLVYFARNPDECLTLEDMAAKWGGDPEGLRLKIRVLLNRQVLASQRTHDPSSRNGLRTLYSAGPELLRHAS
jgi:hypothetical protein